MSRKTTDEDIWKAIELGWEQVKEWSNGQTLEYYGHFVDCTVWFDKNGYTVADRKDRDYWE